MAPIQCPPLSQFIQSGCAFCNRSNDRIINRRLAQFLFKQIFRLLKQIARSVKQIFEQRFIQIVLHSQLIKSARSICCTAFHGRLPRRLRSSISSEAATRCQSRMRRRHKSEAKAGTGRAYAHKHLGEGGVVNVTAVFQPECHGGGGHIPRISA